MPGPDHRNSSRSPHKMAGGALSRRAFISRLLGAAAMFAAALTIAKSRIAEAQSKVKKEIAKYQDTPKNGQKCADCRFFRPPKECQLVEGDIKPEGWCQFFAKKE